MAKFNKATARPALESPVRSGADAKGRTYEGAPGYSRDTRSELFLLAVTNMVGEQTFYEAADARDDRYRALVRTAAVDDPAWTARFLAWLRNGANLRSAALVGALEAAKALAEKGIPGGRQIVDSVLQRPDEPGEALAYWASAYGRAVPKPVKRGIADAAARLYTERAALKYDTAAKGYRFGDVLNLVHAAPRDERQGDLFGHLLDRRYGRVETVPERLTTIRANQALRARATEDPRVVLDPDRLREAGMSWEDALSLVGSKVPKARLWEALIPSMGYMAQLRNLRNFDEAEVADWAAELVAARLADPGEVAKSRQLPMRFLSAYRAAPSLRWSYALEQALDASLANVPGLPGRTLILVDTSGSMRSGFSRDGSLMRWDAATVFGLALARRCAAADVVSFSDRTKTFRQRPGESLLRAVERWKSDGYFIGSGTSTESAVRKHYQDHDRVVILTDEQAHFGGGRDVTAAVPGDRMVYTWNLAGYRHGHAPSGAGTRHTFGGLTDAAFAMIGLLESGRNADWPF
ncbi:TROVE domain-containing protein [Glycomyces luteolus]|uniref:TROVE domain-containing protein n=1 Tax=Glycomyces luteolus TaxID=2670330 RepID=A0A9X3P985_9ACTN|nr:TROVE domain-containing protein [Glycomyces luteolus]MDA1359357.1 TROVE domain-containing protein [Glycomyces luteolus]